MAGGEEEYEEEEEEEEEGAGGGERNNSLCALHRCPSLPAFAAPAGEEGMAADATLAEACTPPADNSWKLLRGIPPLTKPLTGKAHDLPTVQGNC